MKKILLTILSLGFLLSPSFTKAQTFTVTADTVWANVSGSQAVHNDITNTTAPGGLVIKWKCIASDFPATWLVSSVFGICDNQTCWPNTGDVDLWNYATNTGNQHTSNPYTIGTAGTFDLNLDFTSVPVGCHYMKVEMWDGASYTKNVTFVICKVIPSAVQNIANASEPNISLYPNPARDEINVVYEGTDVKNIGVYNIIGKLITVYKVNGRSANLNLENTPAGIYFVKLMNGNGQVVATRKFTKQ
jgi:hypothetical protein